MVIFMKTSKNQKHERDQLNKRTVLHTSLCAGITGIACLFIGAGTDSFILTAVIITVIIFALNFTLRCPEEFISKKINIKKWQKRFYLILLLVINVSVIILSLTYAVQDRIIFYNVNDPESREFLLEKPDYSEVMFTSENGKTYHGMLFKQIDGTAPLIIYFGGNGECSYQHMRLRDQRGYYSGYNYMFIDYEGYGLNKGSPHYLNMYEQSLAVFDYASSLADTDSGRIIVMGYSLGTGCAVYLAASRPAAGLILAAPYASGYDLYNNALPVFKGPFRLLVKQKLPSDQFARRVSCPVLIIASQTDEIIPFSSSKRLSQLFSGSVDFMELDNVNHNGIFRAEGVYDRVQLFLDKEDFKKLKL